MAKGFWTGVRLPSPPPKNKDIPEMGCLCFLVEQRGESKVQAMPTGTACRWGPGSGCEFYGEAKSFMREMV
jgi:hypothetical protein